MVLPHFMGPTLIKILLQALLCGYCVSSLRRITGSRWSLLLYLLFLSPPMLTQGISAHRMPTYGVLFLFLVAKLVFDRLERKALPLSHAVGLCILASILTYWRSEGIYLLVFGIVWILLAYRIPRGRAMARLLVLFYGIQLLTAAPQLLAMAQSDAPSELRLEPLYAYAVTNMLRCGLDRDAAAEDLAVIDQYIPLETLDTLNETRGDENYGGANALYYTRDGATYKLRLAFCAAARHLIFQQPLVYLLSQWGAWLYLESLSPLDFSGGLSGIVQGLSMFTWRITPPLLLLVACLLISLFQRCWFLFWLSGCGVGNWLLVALLMPAAFFKYFYATWLMGWFLTLAVLILLLARQRGRRLA